MTRRQAHQIAKDHMFFGDGNISMLKDATEFLNRLSRPSSRDRFYCNYLISAIEKHGGLIRVRGEGDGRGST